MQMCFVTKYYFESVYIVKLLFFDIGVTKSNSKSSPNIILFLYHRRAVVSSEFSSFRNSLKFQEIDIL